MRRHSLLLLSILCVGIGVVGLSTTESKPPEPKRYPCGFDRTLSTKVNGGYNISCWGVKDGQWTTQPILMLSGEEFEFGRPQQYADKLKAYKAAWKKWYDDGRAGMHRWDESKWEPINESIRQFEEAEKEFK